MLRAILGLIPATIVAIILFFINPIIGILWVIWLTILVIYVVRRDLLTKFFHWLFGTKK